MPINTILLVFLSAGSHFDNSGANKGPSAKYVQGFFAKQTLPIIFAADTNLQVDNAAYATWFTNVPISLIEMRISSPLCKVNESGGTIPVPVSRKHPCGKL